MFSIIQAAGWPIWPLLLSSVIAVTLIIERFVSLRRVKIVPSHLLNTVMSNYRRMGVNDLMLSQLVQHSPLGTVLAAGLRNFNNTREVMKEAVEEAGQTATHELERFLTTLGTIASISPLLGLLGTVVGMIELFGIQGGSGPMGTDPQQLAHGISVALYNTAFGLLIAIPTMICYRHFRALIDSFVIEMQQQAIKLVESISSLPSSGR